MKVNIRWMLRSDLSKVLEIEKLCFRDAWSEDHFLEYLRQRNVIGMVAEFGNEIVGYVVYSLEKTVLIIENIAVDPAFQCLGVATQIVENLKFKLSQQRRHRIELNLAESNLEAQLFFQAQGFYAVDILRDFYENGETAYAMDFRLLDSDVTVGTFIDDELESAE